MALPMKTTAEDLEKLSAYMRTQVGWVAIDNIKAAIPPKHVHGLKLEAMKFLGLLERDGANVKLTDAGRQYANGDDAARASTMRDRLRSIPLYYSTLQWMHFTAGADTISKTELANYWHDHSGELGGAQGDALTDATVFFMRMVGISGLARFVAAGSGRDTELRIVPEQLAEFVTGAPPPVPEPVPEQQQQQPPQQQPPSPQPLVTTVGAGLHVNVEIHIAADAKPATIEEIFKNMRKYLMDPRPETTDGS